MSPYKPEYFQLYEWLPKSFYNRHKELGNKLWLMFDYRILWTQDQLRKRYGRCIMNTWYWGGHNQYRGWRPWNCHIGAQFSQHKFARAADSMFTIPTEEIRQDILANEFDSDFQYISVIEDNVPWLHIDCRNLEFSDGIILI